MSAKTQLPRNPRNDKFAKKKKIYKYQRWNTKRDPSQLLHKSHMHKNDGPDLALGQKLPDYCILCPKQFYTGRPKLMIDHYNAKHYKNAVIIRNIIHMRCKCSDVPSRGSDGRVRNVHFHCMTCFKPCDKAQQLAVHLVTRENFKPEEVNFLYDNNRPKVGLIKFEPENE